MARVVPRLLLAVRARHLGITDVDLVVQGRSCQYCFPSVTARVPFRIGFWQTKQVVCSSRTM